MPRASATEVSTEDVEAVFADSLPKRPASGKAAAARTGAKSKKGRGRRDPAARATPGVTKKKAFKSKLTTRTLRDPFKQKKISPPKRILLNTPTSAARLSKPLQRKSDDAARMSSMKRRRTLESRVAEFAEASHGSALLVTTTKGGVERGGRTRVAASGLFQGIEDVPLRRVLAYIVDSRADLWTASGDVPMGRVLAVLASGHPMRGDLKEDEE